MGLQKKKGLKTSLNPDLDFFLFFDDDVFRLFSSLFSLVENEEPGAFGAGRRLLWFRVGSV